MITSVQATFQCIWGQCFDVSQSVDDDMIEFFFLVTVDQERHSDSNSYRVSLNKAYRWNSQSFGTCSNERPSFIEKSANKIEIVTQFPCLVKFQISDRSKDSFVIQYLGLNFHMYEVKVDLGRCRSQTAPHRPHSHKEPLTPITAYYADYRTSSNLTRHGN